MPSEREAIQTLLRQHPDKAAWLKKKILEGKLRSIDELTTIPEGEEIVIVAGPDHGGVEGSKQVSCTCGRLIWLSPSTQENMRRWQGLPQRVVCPSCVVDELKKEGTGHERQQ